MKHLLFPLLLVFSVNVYSETYYCTQQSSTFLTSHKNKEDNTHSKGISNEIYRLEVDFKNKKVDFGKLEKFSTTYTIIDGTKEGFVASIVSTRNIKTINLQSLLFSNQREYDEKPTLIVIFSSTTVAKRVRYFCSKDNK